MLKLEEEPPLQSAKVQALSPPPEEIWEPGHGVHLLVVIHILLSVPKVTKFIISSRSLTHSRTHVTHPIRPSLTQTLKERS